jgi:hypothetical protein
MLENDLSTGSWARHEIPKQIHPSVFPLCAPSSVRTVCVLLGVRSLHRWFASDDALASARARRQSTQWGKCWWKKSWAAGWAAQLCCPAELSRIQIQYREGLLGFARCGRRWAKAQWRSTQPTARGDRAKRLSEVKTHEDILLSEMS